MVGVLGVLWIECVGGDVGYLAIWLFGYGKHLWSGGTYSRGLQGFVGQGENEQ